MATENVKINLDVEAKSLSSLINDADSLRTALNKATDPKEVEKLNKEFDTTKKKIKDIEKASKDFSLEGTFESVYGEVQPLNTRLGELEDRMYELAFAGQTNTEEFRSMQAEASNMRKTIIDVDRQVDLMAENKGIGVFGAGLSNVGDSLMRLDFETAAQDAAKLAAASQAMSFGTAAKSLKKLGSTFAQLGKALLTNPIFLIAAVIAGVVAAAVALMDELGLLEVIMDAIGAVFEWLMIPINALIDGLKALTDWFGWTSNAAEEAAEKEAEAAKKAADAQEKATNRTVSALDHKIRMMKADGEVTDEEFVKMIEMEKQKRKSLMQTAKTRFEEADAAAKAAVIKGDLDEEELKDLRDKRDEMQLAYQESLNEIEGYELESQTLIKQRKDQQAKENQADLDENTKKEKDELSKRRAAWEEYQQNRLDAQRQIQDLVLELMEEGSEKELAEIDTKYDRLIEDTKSNETLNQEEKLKIIDHYNNLRLQKEKEVNDKIKADEEATRLANIEKAKQQSQLLTELRNTEIENELLAVEQKYADELELAEGNAELEKELLNRIESEKDAIRKKYKDEDVAATEAAEKAKQDAIKETQDKEKAQRQATTDAAIGAANSLLDTIIANTEEGSKAQENAMVAQVIMNAAMGAVNAFSQSMQLGPIAGPIVGAALVASIAGMAAKNISDIKSARSSGGSGGGGGGGISAPSTTSIQQPQETPSVNLFGGANQGSEGGASMFDSQEGGNQPQQIKAVVSWSDIDAVQNSDDNLQNEMQL